MLWLCLALLLAQPAPRFTMEPGPGARGDVSGVVVDERGAPLAGLTVRLRTIAHRPPPVVEVVTDAHGRFAAHGVPGSSDGTVVEFLRGPTRLLRHDLDDSALERALTVRVRLGELVKVSGRFAAPDARGGEVRVFTPLPPRTEGRVRDRSITHGLAELNPDGTFSFDLQSGDYTLEWSRPEGVLFRAPLHAPGAGLVLTPPAGGLEGRLTTKRGQAIKSASVRVTGPGTDERGASVSTDATGRYRLLGLVDGEYVVEAKEGRTCHARRVAVKGGLATEPIVFGAGWSVRGTVVDPARRGTAWVSARVVLGASALCDGQVTEPDAKGRFTVEDVSADAVELVGVATDRGAPATLSVTKFTPQPVTLRLPRAP